MRQAVRKTPAACLLLLAPLLLPLLAGCLSISPLPTATPTAPEATQTPAFVIPTLIPTLTWTPAVAPPATSEPGLGRGEIIFRDDFEQDRGWDLGQDVYGATSLSSGRLTLASRFPRIWRFALSPVLPERDFYMEVSLRADICSSGDEFGVTFRYESTGSHYRFGLRCEGGVRVHRISGSTAFALVPSDQTNIVVPGPPNETMLAVLASNSQFRFFINDVEAFSAPDTSLIPGFVGVYIFSGSGGQTTVSFDDLIIRNVSTAPSATATLGFPEEPDGP
jgi:hypothetical protein